MIGNFDSKGFFVETYLKNKNEFPNVLYMHSPFCDGICNYCRFRGININTNKDVIDKFYNEDLLNEINEFKILFDNVNFDEVYFGGGTVNFSESTEYLEKMISIIPNFSKINKKSIEINPRHCNEQYFELLKKYNFDYVSIGVQSLSKKTCELENRHYCSVNKLNDIIINLKNNKMYTNIDVILNLKNESIDDSFNDYETILNIIKPDSLTIQPNKLYCYEVNDFITIYNGINKILNKFNDYILINANLSLQSFISDFIFHQKYGIEYRIINKKTAGFENYLFNKKATNDFYGVNVLGIGYVPNIYWNHAFSFSGDIHYDNATKTISTLPIIEKEDTILSKKILEDNYRKICGD